MAQPTANVAVPAPLTFSQQLLLDYQHDVIEEYDEIQAEEQQRIATEVAAAAAQAAADAVAQDLLARSQRNAVNPPPLEPSDLMKIAKAGLEDMGETQEYYIIVGDICDLEGNVFTNQLYCSVSHKNGRSRGVLCTHNPDAEFGERAMIAEEDEALDPPACLCLLHDRYAVATRGTSDLSWSQMVMDWFAIKGGFFGERTFVTDYGVESVRAQTADGKWFVRELLADEVQRL
ncbi:hypothetical protein LTR17_019488 [Elasticomyces elasticus]|nr:hypothetical protein LTR17_019488 [Elasticomyces elasticus]